MLFVMILEFTGIIFYSYAFQQMMIILSLTKTYDETIEDRDDKLDKWLMDRLKHVTSKRNAQVIEKTREAFEFMWKWDIEKIFNNDFYYQVESKIRKGIFNGPVDFIVNRFSCFFSAVPTRDILMKLVHEMRPKE